MTHANDVAVGIVGLGGIGHHHATKLVDRGATLVGGMDIDADARRRFHEEFDVHAYEDESDLYEDCDAVLITTPNRFHEYAVSALEAGRSTCSWRSRWRTPSKARSASPRPPVTLRGSA